MIMLDKKSEILQKHFNIREWEKDSKLHGHNFLELMYVMEGKIMHICNNEAPKTISSGQYIFIDYGNIHSFITENAKMINIAFTPQLIDSKTENCRSVVNLMATSKFAIPNIYNMSFPSEKILTDEDGEILNLLKMIQTQTKTESALSFSLVRQYMISILLKMAQPFYNNDERSLSKLTKNVIKIIDEYYSCSNPLEIASEKLCYSPSSISLQFRKDFGTTFKDYLLNKRLAEAKYLLETTDKKIPQISLAVGYSDPKFFTKVFKSHTGLTPSQYRKKNASSTDIPIQQLL